MANSVMYLSMDATKRLDMCDRIKNGRKPSFIRTILCRILWIYIENTIDWNEGHDDAISSDRACLGKL